MTTPPTTDDVRLLHPLKTIDKPFLSAQIARAELEYGHIVFDALTPSYTLEGDALESWRQQIRNEVVGCMAVALCAESLWTISNDKVNRQGEQLDNYNDVTDFENRWMERSRQGFDLDSTPENDSSGGGMGIIVI